MKLWTALLFLALPVVGQETKTLHLSGTGFGNEVAWEFRMAAGRGAGNWTTIPVPSQWEQHGFGTYNYGHDEEKAPDIGFYRKSFEVPADWIDRRIEIVFEGVMTDATVKIDGQVIGPTHRGGFTRFSYDITRFVQAGRKHSLEVEVHETSADESVELAERDADYWVFGGIYRPVFLRSTPLRGIDQIAIAARHDGQLRARVRLHGIAEAHQLSARVLSTAGAPVAGPFEVEVRDQSVEIAATIKGIAPWSAESPNLYVLAVELVSGGVLRHRVEQRFGFRTIEINERGLLINDRPTRLRGVNRHAFWPASGRTLNAQIDRDDVLAIKALNLNAVRTSHYPPDVSFLEACDELGLYVLDELPGWHDPYDTEVGRLLVREMVERDVNHPSVIVWTNGNEGGWNSELDQDFRRHDPQGRPILHPDRIWGGVDTRHYPTYVELDAWLDPQSLSNRWRSLFGPLPWFLPTEFLHGLYDGGGGAGLEDYWRLLGHHPRALGGFFWSFTDESIERSDRGRALDSAGNYAPDGLLGPYREESGSALAVRQFFAPIAFRYDEAKAVLEVENRFDETLLEDCFFSWSLLRWPAPGQSQTVVVAQGDFEVPAAPPGAKVPVELDLPFEADASALRLVARDRHGREVAAEVLALARSSRRLVETIAGPAIGRPRHEQSGTSFRLSLGDSFAEIDESSLSLTRLGRGGKVLNLAGPRPLGGAFAAEQVMSLENGRVASIDFYHEGARFSWRIEANGWLSLRAAPGQNLPELFFEIARERLESLDYLGLGPARVWRNRPQGQLGFWRKEKAKATDEIWGHEPKFDGVYGDVRWAKIRIDGVDLILVFADPVFLSVGQVQFPADAKDARADVLDRGGLALLAEPPAIGTKFDEAQELTPWDLGERPRSIGTGTLWLRIAEPDQDG